MESNKPDQPGKDRVNILSKLWRGEVPLVISYWVFGVIGGLVWRIVAQVVARNKVEAVLLSAALVGYYIIVYVGTWRAAYKYKGKKEWAFLAKCAVVVGTIFLIRGFASTP